MVIINDFTNDRKVPFEEITKGNVFKIDERFFLKTSTSSAVCLNNGDLVDFTSYEKILPVSAEINIEELE